jgi:putative transposase
MASLQTHDLGHLFLHQRAQHAETDSVTLGGRRVAVQRPRVRGADGSGEVAMSTYAHFADRDPLTKVVLEQMLAGDSTHRFARTREPVDQAVVDAEGSTSKNAVSREFVGRTGEHLRALMARSLADVRLAALMLDGLELKGRCCVVALGVSTDGVKVPLGLWDGLTENKRVCVELLADLVDRGPGLRRGVLVILTAARHSQLGAARRRDLAQGSRRYTDPERFLISRSQWPQLPPSPRAICPARCGPQADPG